MMGWERRVRALEQHMQGCGTVYRVTYADRRADRMTGIALLMRLLDDEAGLHPQRVAGYELVRGADPHIAALLAQVSGGDSA